MHNKSCTSWKDVGKSTQHTTLPGAAAAAAGDVHTHDGAWDTIHPQRDSINPREAAHAATLLHGLGVVRAAQHGDPSVHGLQSIQVLKLLGVLVEQVRERNPRLSFERAVEKV